MQNGGVFDAGLNTNLEQPQEDFAIHPDVTIPAGFHTFNELFAILFTDPSRTVSGNVRVSTGDFYSGTRKALLLGAVLRLGAKFSTQVAWSLQRHQARGRRVHDPPSHDALRLQLQHQRVSQRPRSVQQRERRVERQRPLQYHPPAALGLLCRLQRPARRERRRQRPRCDREIHVLVQLLSLESTQDDGAYGLVAVRDGDKNPSNVRKNLELWRINAPQATRQPLVPE